MRSRSHLPVFTLLFFQIQELTLIFLVTLLSNFRAIPGTSPELLNLNKDHPSKKVYFIKFSKYWSFDDCSHRNIRVAKLWLLYSICNITCFKWLSCIFDVMDKNCDVITYFFKKNNNFKESWNSQFCWHQ